jgi:hypothetical protein
MLQVFAQIVGSHLLPIVYRTISSKQINAIHAPSTTNATIRITRITLAIIANLHISLTQQTSLVILHNPTPQRRPEVTNHMIRHMPVARGMRTF